jgi:hypothetical protein
LTFATTVYERQHSIRFNHGAKAASGYGLPIRSSPAKAAIARFAG